MYIFWKKKCKIVSASGAPPTNLRLLLAAEGSALKPLHCYSRLLQLCQVVSSAKH